MTPEQINRVCAELHGWKHNKYYDSEHGRRAWVQPDGRNVWEDQLPKYTESLKDAQELFKSLTEEEQEACASILCDLVAFDSEGWTETQVVKLMKATPAQWCEAILRAVEKWRGNEAT